jgi:hypothetical protein
MIPGPILESILAEFRLQSRNIDSVSILENIDLVLILDQKSMLESMLEST